MTNWTTETRGKTKILRLSGDLLIQGAGELKSMLLEALTGTNDLEIDVSSVTEADISCLQLLCATHKAGMKLGKNVSFGNTRSAAFMDTMREAYFLRHTGCSLDTKKQCPWIEG